jgi:hypothetical protein
MSREFRPLARSAAIIATGQLGWSPAQFWASTAAELAQAMEGRFGPAAPVPLGRDELQRLEEGLGHG